MYEFQSNMKFSKDGSLDELIALDRYAVTTTNTENILSGDVVVFVSDEIKGTSLVGTVGSSGWTFEDGDYFNIVARNGEKFDKVRGELVRKPYELEPQDLWARWSYGASLVEDESVRDKWVNEFRWLFDGYRYSPGGRIQLGLGHEYLGLPKAPLTLTNCFVLEPTKGVHPTTDTSEIFTPVLHDEVYTDAIAQWDHVIDTVLTEMQISRRGGGVGINISNICSVGGANGFSISLSLPDSHPDAKELSDMRNLGKFDVVDVVNTHKLGFYDVGITVEDSIDGHIYALRSMIKAAYEHSDIVIDFSNIRHRNAVVKGVNGRSSGAAAWMELFAITAKILAQDTIDAVDFAEIFSFVINLIQQGGSRRGALMLVCNDNHPCVRKFIERKKTPGFLQGANISVGLSEEFMTRVKLAKEGWETPNGAYSEAYYRELDLWDLIIESAHASAEPGVIWLEYYNRMSNSWYYMPIVATNPCGIH